jgi:hypothetical protein
MGICGSIFVLAYESTTASSNLSNAVFLAENAAESFHLSDEPVALAKSLGGLIYQSGEIKVYCDRLWQPTEPDNAFYILSLCITEEGNLKTADISVSSGDKEIFNLLSTKNIAFTREVGHD